MRYDQMCKHHDQRTMTLDHGRLLQDSGFLKLDSPRRSSKNSARITMREVTEWYYQSVMAQARQYSGKPGTYTIQLMGGPSTLANHPIAAGYIASIRSNIKPELTRAVILHQLRQAMEKLIEHTVTTRWCSPRIYCPPSRWERLAPGQAMPSWAQSLPITLPNSYSHLGHLSRRGLTPTLRAKRHDYLLPRPYDTSALGLDIYAQLKTRSATASGKYGST